MKVHNLGPIKSITNNEQSQVRGKQQQNSTLAVAGPIQAQLRHLSQDANNDIDLAKVGKLKKAIEQGRLVTDSDKIADALIANAHELIRKGGSE